MFVIDNYAKFSEMCPHQEENIIIISREAASYGIYLIIANTGDIRSMVQQNMSTSVGLQLSSKYDYNEILKVNCDITPQSGIAGRGLIKYPAPLEFQAALCLKSDTGKTINYHIGKQFEIMQSQWNGKIAPQIPEVPEDMSYHSFVKYADVCDARNEGAIPIGYDIDEASVFGIFPKDNYCYTVSGHDRSGKTNLLRLIVTEAISADGDIVLIDNLVDDFAEYKERCSNYIKTDRELFDYMSNKLIPQFKERNVVKSGGENMDKFKTISIVIADLRQFCEMIYTSEVSMTAFLELTLSKGVGHNIVWYAGVLLEDIPTKYGASVFFQKYIGYKEGIHFGGEVDKKCIFSLNLPYSELTKRVKPGIGYIDNEDDTRTIITAKM